MEVVELVEVVEVCYLLVFFSIGTNHLYHQYYQYHHYYHYYHYYQYYYCCYYSWHFLPNNNFLINTHRQPSLQRVPGLFERKHRHQRNPRPLRLRRVTRQFVRVRWFQPWKPTVYSNSVMQLLTLLFCSGPVFVFFNNHCGSK